MEILKITCGEQGIIFREQGNMDPLGSTLKGKFAQILSF